MAAFLILHGYAGSGPDHWQSWLAGRLRRAGEHVAYPDLPDPFAPQLDAWRAALAAELRLAPERPTVVCHSLACNLWLHHVAAAPGPELRAARVLLVAPPGDDTGISELDSFFPVPLHADAVGVAAPGGTRLVCSDDDPYCRAGALDSYAAPLALPHDVLPGAGHVNPEAGFGPWPAVEQWCLGERPGLL